MFVVLGLSMTAPLIYLKKFADQRYIDTSVRTEPWALSGVCYIGGCLLYVMRFPERFFPKQFDKFGSSHQIFHIAVVVGNAVNFNENMRLFLSRKQYVCPIVFAQ